MRTIAAHSEPITAVQFAPSDQGQLVSSSFDCSCRIWDVGSGQMLSSLPKFDRDLAVQHEENHPLACVHFTPNGKYVLVSSLDSTIRLWDWKAQTCLKTFKGHVNNKFSVTAALSRVGSERLVVGASEDSKIYVWSLQGKQVLQTLSGHDGAYRTRSVCVDPQYFFASSISRLLFSGIVMAVDAHPTRALIASCGFDQTIRIWQAESN